MCQPAALAPSPASTTDADGVRRGEEGLFDPGRRAVLHSAAWAVPAVVLTASSPAAAVSGAALSFSAANYRGLACGLIDDVVVRVSHGAAPIGGVSVVLEVSGGFTFDAGAVSTTVLTGVDGTAACGSIHVPAAGTGTITATTTDATGASATLTGFDARLVSAPRGLVDATSITAGSTPVVLDLFLSGTTLFRSGIGAVVTGVAAVGTLAPSADDTTALVLPLRLADGRAAVLDTRRGALTAVEGIPVDAAPLTGDLFRRGSDIHRGSQVLVSDLDVPGQLIEHDDGTPLGANLYLPYRAVDGTPRLLRLPGGDTRTAFEFGSDGGPPSGARPIADDLFFADGAIHRVSWDGTSAYGVGAVASGIASFGTLTPNPYFAGERLLPVVTTAGEAAVFMASGNAVRAVDAVPSGAAPIGADLFRVGKAIYQGGVGVVATDAAMVGQPSPTSRGESRVVLPVSGAVASC